MSKRLKSARSPDTSVCAFPSNPAKRPRPPMPRVESERRELASRSNNGIDVTLNWHPALDELTVCVRDQRNSAYFEIHPQRNKALDVYNHPYAYADFAHVYQRENRLAS